MSRWQISVKTNNKIQNIYSCLLRLNIAPPFGFGGVYNKLLPIFQVCRSVGKNLSVYAIKASYHGKCFNDFCPLLAMHQ